MRDGLVEFIFNLLFPIVVHFSGYPFVLHSSALIALPMADFLFKSKCANVLLARTSFVCFQFLVKGEREMNMKSISFSECLISREEDLLFFVRHVQKPFVPKKNSWYCSATVLFRV